MKLNGKQLRFVEEYLKDHNATQAAIRAGVSEKSAATMGSRWLQTPAVQEAIKPVVAAAQERAAVEASTVLRELLNIATFDPKDLLNDDGSPKPLSEMSENVRRAIGSIEVEVLRRKGEGDDGPFERSQAHVAKIRMLDKLRALELLGKHLQLFTEKVEHKHSGTIHLVDPYAEPASSK